MIDIENLASNVKSEFIGRLASTIFSALITVILARLLDTDDFGLLFLAISVFAVIEIASKLGIGRSAGRYVAEYKEDNQGQVPHIIRFSILFNIISIGIVSIFVYFFYSDLVHLIGEPELIPLFTLGLLFIAFSTLETYTRRVLQGFEAIKLTALLQVLGAGGNFILVVGFVLLGYGVLGAFLGYVLSYILTTVTGLGLIYFKFYNTSEIAESMEDGLARRLGEYTIPLTITDTAHVVDKHLDKILVGALLNPVAVGYYTVGKQVIKFIETPATSVGFALSPTFGAQKASGNIKAASRIYESTLVYSLLLYIPAAAGLFLVAEPTIKLIFGSEYLGAVPILQVFAIYAVVQALTKITSDGLDYLGRAKIRAIARGLTSVLNIVLNVILISVIGVVGAALATVASYSLYMLITMYLIHIEFDLRIRYLLTQISTIIAISIVMSSVVFVVVEAATGIFSLSAVVLLGVSIWFILSISTGLLDMEEIRSLVDCLHSHY